MDGLLLPLPSTQELHTEDYFSRICSYPVNTLLVCDGMRRFYYVYTGRLGSAHDMRVFSNSDLSQQIDLNQRLQ